MRSLDWVFGLGLFVGVAGCGGPQDADAGDGDGTTTEGTGGTGGCSDGSGDSGSSDDGGDCSGSDDGGDDGGVVQCFDAPEPGIACDVVPTEPDATRCANMGPGCTPIAAPAAMPLRHDPRVFVDDERLVLFGGWISESGTTDYLQDATAGLCTEGAAFDGRVYDPVVDTWAEIPEPGPEGPAPRTQFVSAVVGDDLIVFGGFEHEHDGGAFGLSTQTWRTISSEGAPDVCAGGALAAISRAGRMFVVPALGVASGGDSWVYDPDADAWSAMPPWPLAPRRTTPALALGDRLYVWSGNTLDTAEAYGDGAYYDVTTETWTVMNDAGAPDRRYRTFGFVDGERLVYFAGLPHWDPCNQGEPCPQPDPVLDGGIYDTTTDTWTAIPPLSAPNVQEIVDAELTGGVLVALVRYGAGSDGTSPIWTYDLAGGSWTGGGSAGGLEVFATGAHGPAFVGAADGRVLVGRRLGLREFATFDVTGGIVELLPGVMSDAERQAHLLAWIGDRAVLLGGHEDTPTEECIEVGDEAVWLECRHQVRAFDDGAVLIP